MTKNRRLLLPLGGALAGLGLGLAYWFVWGCRSCAADNSPVAIVGLFTAVCAVMAHLWGKDHLPSS